MTDPARDVIQRIREAMSIKCTQKPPHQGGGILQYHVLCEGCVGAMVSEVFAQPEMSIELRLRQELWINHGHDEGPTLYGDDGEMQCKHPDCVLLWDYRRAPIDKLIAHVDIVRHNNAMKLYAAVTADLR